MCKRFLKLNLDNDEAEFLALKHPNAFILLFFIAKRARRTSGQADGLIIGDALIGSSDLEPGMSRQNFRTALNKLVEFGYIKIVSNGKRFFERQKSTIKLTITGMLVNICKSTVFDINSEDVNQLTNQRLTNDQPTTNHKQERRRIDISNDIPEYVMRDEAHPALPIRSKDSLIFNFEKWEFEGITEKDIGDWKVIYSHIDLQVEMLKSTEWLKSNPSKNRKKNWRKYLTGWFGRANDTIENKKAYRSASSSSQTDRRTKNTDGIPIHTRAEDLF